MAEAAEKSKDTKDNKEKKTAKPTRQEQMDSLFKGKKWDIVKEIKLEGDARFMTPFGNKGKNGFMLVPKGQKPTKENAIVVGGTVLQKAAEDYSAVELPEKPTRQRGSGSKQPELSPEERAALARQANADLFDEALSS